jgi:hypothetical protein
MVWYQAIGNYFVENLLEFLMAKERNARQQICTYDEKQNKKILSIILL